MKNKETLEEALEKFSPLKYKGEMKYNKIDMIEFAKWQQERICDSEVIQRIRASKSDAEARRIIRTI